MPPADKYEITDPNEFEVTAAGRQALRPILGTFGPSETLLVSFLSFMVGLMAGAAYVAQQFYLTYFPTLVTILAVIVAV